MLWHMNMSKYGSWGGDNLLLFAVFCCFFLCLNVCVFFFSVYFIFSKSCVESETLPLIKLFSFNRMIFTKPRENQKTKKPKLFRECLVWGSCLVFFGFPRVFLFFLVMTLKKLKKLKVFWFFEGTLTWSKAKNQKNSALFWFFAWIVVTCLLEICPKTKKDLSFFGFLPYFK